MSALPLTVVLQLIAACAPTVAPSTMASVLRTESGFDPNELHVNGPNGGDIHPATKADAIVQAIDLIVVQRKSVDLGLGQVNSGNLASLGLSVADALDPCKKAQ
jgi:type IV secretion system protein VirB1